jgi:hypothetical protein
MDGRGANPVITTSNGTGSTGYIDSSTGTVTVEEILTGQTSPSWDFTSVTCQEDTDPATPILVAQGPAITLNGLQLNHNYSCTFTNTRRAMITVFKVTDPANSLQAFDVSINGTGTVMTSSIGSISTVAPQVFEVTAGTYNVSEAPVSGWDMTKTTCSGIEVVAGQLASCTITNTQRGHLVVTKHTDPASDDSTNFPVTASGSAPSGAPAITGDASRVLKGNNSSTDYEVAGGGTYSVEETVPAGWDQTETFNCSNVNVAPGTNRVLRYHQHQARTSDRDQGDRSVNRYHDRVYDHGKWFGSDERSVVLDQCDPAHHGRRLCRL